MTSEAKLGDVLRRHNEIIHPGDRTSGTAVFVGLEHIEAQTGRRIGAETIDLAALTGRKPTFRKDHIVYGYLRPYLNKVWVAEFDGCSSVDQFAFEVNPDAANTAYIAAYMRSETFLQRAVRATTTGQLPRISIEEIERVTLPLPPVAEQERIAARLGAALALVDKARRASEERVAAAEALPAAYLREAFEGEDAEDWPARPLAELLDGIEAGTSLVAESRRAEPNEVGVLKVSAVSWGEFDPTANKAVPREYKPADHERVRVGDFLISRCNTAELAGAVVLVRQTPPNLMLSDKTLRLVLKSEVCEAAYLEHALRTPQAREFIESRATGTSQSMRNISQETIRLIPVPLPPLPTQRAVVSALHKRTLNASALLARCREELAAIEALPAALLREAFGGHEG